MPDPVTRLNAALEGRYRIERELGEGGMATVYLADDLKHNRKVALKVLKPELAAVVGAERFLAEIQVTANLQHPHILPLFDSGEADGFLFYVMPYVEGETLRDRIDREKQLPVDEAVALASKVAGALHHAHEHGVIHRDIKPGNILLQDGEPVVADFGIALAVGAAGSNRLTETGLSLGTPYYMSPEQATGDQAVGASTDTYALGSVLYEMLVGDPPFAGSTAQAVLGKIIAGKSVSAMEERPSVPPNVDAAVRCALEKLPADRFTSAQDFAKALGDEHFRYGEMATAGASAAVGPWNRLTIAMTATTLLFALAFGWSMLRPDPTRAVTRVSVSMPEDQSFDPNSPHLDLSPDGSVLVYRGGGGTGQPQLWLRPLDDLNATPIRGTENPGHPAFSPDGLEVAFDQGGAIRVISLQGGVTRTLIEGGRQPVWSPDGAWIYYTYRQEGLRRVPAGGGEEEIITEVNRAGEDAHAFAHVLPGGRKILYQVYADEPSVRALDLETGEDKVVTLGRYPRYSSTGHLLFLDDTATLLAAPFDVERLELTGVARPVAEQLMMYPNGMGFFKVSEAGSLMYVTAGEGRLTTPVWVERDGTASNIDPGWSTYGSPNFSTLALSPNGDRLAISMIQSLEATWDLWVKQLDMGPLSKITFEGTRNRGPTWSRDGQSLTFVSNRAGQDNLWTKRADGSGSAELVLDRGTGIREGFYSPDGTWLVLLEVGGPAGFGDIHAIRPGMDSVAVPLVATEFVESSPVLSPDGRWLAYVSNETGRDEVYVRPFPDVDVGRDLVSTSGGVEPMWAHSGRELFYRNGANELVAVQVTGDPTFVAGRQEVLFSMVDYLPGRWQPMYDVSPDDRRFVMLRIGDEETGASELILVENWAEELRGQAGN